MFPWGSHASAFAYVNVPLSPLMFCETLVSVYPSEVCIPMYYFLLRFSVHLGQWMLWASVEKPVQSAVLCCAHARGSLMFAVALSCLEHSFCYFVEMLQSVSPVIFMWALINFHLSCSLTCAFCLTSLTSFPNATMSLSMCVHILSISASLSASDLSITLRTAVTVGLMC